MIEMLQAVRSHREFLIRQTKELGRLLLAWRNDGTMRQTSDVSKGQLWADRNADAFLRSGLQSLELGIPVVSEEDAGHSDDRAETYWLIDPIDGTASWRDGYKGFAVQLALVHRGVAHFGIVHAPALDRTYVGQLGEASTVNDTPLKPLVKNDRLVITDNTPRPHGIAATAMAALNANGYYESGSLGLKSCLVADGTADLFLKDVVIRDWDIAPVMPILSGVNGILSLATGQPFELAGSYQKPDGLLVARDKDLWSAAAAFAHAHARHTSTT
jgi:3'(2'), 5'-bisphosphate nucleotidase